jgi:hypothetical protein
VRASGSQRPATTLVARVQRRQPNGVLGQLGRDGQRAAIDGEAGGLVERGGDAGVRLVLRQREVTSTDEWIIDELRDSPVHAPPLLAEVSVEHRRQQWVREPDRPSLALDHMRRQRRFESGRFDARAREERLRRGAERRGERERLARRGRESGDPCAQELFKGLGDRQRLEWVDVHVENARKLHREEGVSIRSLMNAEQCLARERSAEPVAKELVERADAERSHRQALDRFLPERLVETRRLRFVNETPGQQNANVACGEPAGRKCERARRGCVEPLDVVDGDQNRLIFAEKLQHVAHRDGHRALIDRIA